VKRRKVLVVQCATFALMVASAVLGWRLSDAEGSLAAVRAGLFGVFTLAAFTLFVAVLVDFDRWVDDVRPYPKRAIRRRAGGAVRAVARLIAWVLALYAAVMSRLWSGAGAALTWALGRGGAGLTWSWVQFGHAMSWVLVRYRAGAGRLWRWVGAESAWALGHAGTGMTALWVWLGHWGSWVLVRYRAGVGWVWATTGRAVAFTLSHVGDALTSLWMWLTRTGGPQLVRFRAAMTVFWSWAGAALAWALRGAGTALTSLWVWLTRAGGWLSVRFRAAMTVFWCSVGAGIRRLWRALIGGAREATTIRRKPWYTSAVDTVFGIPPDDTSVNVRRRSRASRRPGSSRRGRAQRPTLRDDESVGSPHATRATAESPRIGDSGARSTGRQVARRGERRKSEELLSAALARFRSAVNQPRDGDDGGEA
jgi:hypothetical protein